MLLTVTISRTVKFLYSAVNYSRLSTFVLIIFFAPVHQTLAEGDTLAFNIRAQSLNNALLQFATTANLELIFTAKMVRGQSSVAVLGSMTPEQALQRLLKNSNLSYRWVSPDSITLIHRSETTATPVDIDILKPNELIDAPQYLTPILVTANPPKSKFHKHPQSYYSAVSSSATKTETPLLETPQSIQIITPKLMADQQNLTISESLRNISGVTPGNLFITPSFDFTLIRGFRSEQLLDGFTQNYNPGDRESLINIEQIEVLKGSNALLYSGGSGSPAGGLVNIISKRPQAERFLEAGIKIGSYQYFQPYLDLNQPINEHVLFRLTGEYTTSDSFIDVLKTDRYNINPTLLITDNENTTLTLQGKFSHWAQADYQGLPATGTVTGNFEIKPELFLGPSSIPRSEAEFYGIWATLEHTLNTTWSFTAKARYAESEFDQHTQLLFGSDGTQADSPLLPPSTWALFNSELFQQQQEISVFANLLAEFNFAQIENKFIFGADYSLFKDQGFIEASILPTALVDLSQPQFNTPFQTPGDRINNVFVDNETYGFFTQLQSTLFNKIHLLAGLRLGHVRIDYRNQDPGFETSAITDATRFLPRFGAVINLTDEFSWFANYAEGMRGQPFFNFSQTPQPEFSRQLETGVKFEFDFGFNGQFAVYQIDRKNIAVTDSKDILLRAVSQGEQRSEGIDVDLNWHWRNQINVLANYAYTDTRYVNNQGNFIVGDRIAGIPRHSGRFWINYNFQHALLSGLSLGAGIYVQSGIASQTPVNNEDTAFYSLDAAINYETEHIKISATIKNLSDEQYFERFNYLGGRYAPFQPLSVYSSIAVRF